MGQRMNTRFESYLHVQVALMSQRKIDPTPMGRLTFSQMICDFSNIVFLRIEKSASPFSSKLFILLDPNKLTHVILRKGRNCEFEKLNFQPV